MNRTDTNQQRASEDKSRIVLHTTILLLCAGVVILSLFFELEDGQVYLLGLRWPHRCPLYETFGVKCVLCGLTRSFCSLAHGNLRRALEFHTLGAVIFTFTCLQIPYRIYALMIYPQKINAKIMNIGLYVSVLLLAVLFVNWLVYLGGLIL